MLMQRRRNLFGSLGAVAMLFTLLVGGAAPATAGIPLDGIAAVVDGAIILESEIADQLRAQVMKFSQTGEQVDVTRLRRRVLDGAIMRVLREQKAKKLGIKLIDAEIDGAMLRLAKRNNVSVDQFKRMLQREGVGYDSFLTSLRDQIYVQKIIRRVILPTVRVSDEEVQDLYKATRQQGQSSGGEQELRIKQILLSIPENALIHRVREIGEKADNLVNQLRGGASFARLASESSDDPSGLNGGEMGWFKQGELLPQIEKIVFKLADGAISKPIRTSQGYHIFAVSERRIQQSHGQAQADKVKVQARHILFKVPKGSNSSASADVRRKLDKLRQQIEAGADFTEMAKKFSQDEGSAKEGGMLGSFARGVMVPSFEDVAFFLKPGVVSEPVRTPFGWHLIEVVKREVEKVNSFAAAKKELRARLREAKTKARYTQWLRDLRLRSFVEYR
ncbi:peptidylprolyl isomerase [Magnetococcus sp. PR-3]|uniref:peptidylprolyl isomerase n=1 Tax=Magnetococcus sp. PR-3 TaxID=3120355 RepID=UPI002FCE625F